MLCLAALTPRGSHRAWQVGRTTGTHAAPDVQARLPAGQRVLEPVSLPLRTLKPSPAGGKSQQETVGLFPDTLFLHPEYPSTSQLSQTSKNTATKHSQGRFPGRKTATTSYCLELNFRALNVPPSPRKRNLHSHKA